jgi:type IV secretion system protein VirB6
MPFSAFTEINSWMQTAFEPLATDLPGQLAQGIIPLVAAGVSLQVAFHGFAVIRGGGGSNHFLDVFAKAMRAFLVFALCLTGSAYVSSIRPIFQELQASLTTYVSGGGSDDIYTQLDAVMQSGISTFDTVHKLLYDREHLSVEVCIAGCKGIHLDGVPAIILQAIVSFVILAFGTFAFIDVQVISQSIVIVLAFGPLFLSGFAFEATSKWAEGWLTSAVKYVMTAIVLLVVVIAAKDQAMKFVSLLADSAGGRDLIPLAHGDPVGAPLYQEQGKLIAIMIVLSALLAKASSIAADMVGSLGIASNAVGMFRSAKGMATGGLKGAVQGAMGGGGMTGAMKGMAMGAAGMHVPGGSGSRGASGSDSRGSKPVNGAGGSSGGSGGGGGAGRGGSTAPAPQKSLAGRARQRLANTAAYAMGSVAGRTIGQTRLPAMAQQARQGLNQARRGLSNAFRHADPAKEASVKSSNRAGPAFRDAWQRSKRP